MLRCLLMFQMYVSYARKYQQPTLFVYGTGFRTASNEVPWLLPVPPAEKPQKNVAVVMMRSL